MKRTTLLPPPPPVVQFEGKGRVRKVILNRPNKLNSLNHEMVSQMLKLLKQYEVDPMVDLLILKGNGKAFCAGGDVVSLIQFSTIGHWTYGTTYIRNLLTLVYLVATYTKPLVSLMDGIVMGAGACLSMNNHFRIVTENTVFAMPEVAIGMIPHTGSSHFLSRLPGHFGEYLGLTGDTLDGNEMVACGLATHFVISKDLPLLEDALERLNSQSLSNLPNVVNKYARKIQLKPNSACMRMELINTCFSKSTVEKILESLEKEVGHDHVEDKFVTSAINSMRKACPSILKIFFRSIQAGRNDRKLEPCLTREYTIVCNILSRKLNSNFYEGCRAMFVDKDKKPKWEPSNLEQVTDDMVAQFFTQLDEEEVEQLPLQKRHDHFFRGTRSAYEPTKSSTPSLNISADNMIGFPDATYKMQNKL